MRLRERRAPAVRGGGGSQNGRAGSASPGQPATSYGSGMRLFERIVLANTAVLVFAAVVLAASPFSISYPAKAQEIVLLAVGVVLMVALDGLLVRRALAPLDGLRQSMRRIDPLHPGERLDLAQTGEDLTELARAFNDMADRLEAERRQAARRELESREDERRTVARELHDEVGQSLTALLALLDGVQRSAPGELHPALTDAREAARSAMEQVRGVVGRLRPDTLEDLGLVSALRSLSRRIAHQTDLDVHYELDEHLPPLDRDAELVVYRIAQEALTNTVRHARARSVRLSLSIDDGGLELVVQDDGRGLPERVPIESGLRGMRERALLVGGTLSVTSRPRRGTEVRLRVPILEVHE
jgi:two-component system, NarL family, sensor histidine kinase UhpB